MLGRSLGDLRLPLKTILFCAWAHGTSVFLTQGPITWRTHCLWPDPDAGTPLPLTHTHTATRDGGDGRAGVVPVLSEEAKSNTLPGSGGRESRKSVGGKTLPRAWEISTLRAGEGESVCMYVCVWREVGM